MENLNKLIHKQESLLDEKASLLDSKSGAKQLAPLAVELIDRYNQILMIAGTLRAFIESFISTDSYNKEALKKESEFDQVRVKLDKIEVKLIAWIGKIANCLVDMLAVEPALRAHQYFLDEAAKQSKYLMSEKEEALASEMSLSGSNAWSKLQGTITSQLSTDFELDGKVQHLPAPALINLRSHPDGDVRRAGMKQKTSPGIRLKEPLAAAMNGIKGEVNTLNRRRGRKDARSQLRLICRTLIVRHSMPCSPPCKIPSPCSAVISKPRPNDWAKRVCPGGTSFAPVGKTTTDIPLKKPKPLFWNISANSLRGCAAFATTRFRQSLDRR